MPPRLEEAPALLPTDAFDGPPGSLLTDFRNQLLWGDNLLLMEALLPRFEGRIDLAYLDPPFNAGHDWAMTLPLGEGTGMGVDRAATVQAVAYPDTWDDGAYLQMLYARLLQVRELLSPTGSLIVHVSWQVAHLVRALLDEVFGPGERRGAGRPGFRNEIIWGYGGGGAARNAYRRKHDNLFWYTRSDRWTFNPQYRPYTEGTRGRGLTRVKGPRYRLREEGATLETWWTDAGVQKILSPTASENLKYPTQKPEALLERIIRGHSHPGDLVADFFCGSGTTGAVAERLGRRWLMADQGRLAVQLARKRLAQVQAERAAAGEAFRGFDCYALGECGEASRQSAQSIAPGDGPACVTPQSALRTPRSALYAELLTHADETLDVRLLDFRPALPAAAGTLPKALRERARNAGFDFIDYWAADWEYAAPVFRHRWQSCRSPRDRRIRLESDARYPREAGSLYPVAVKVVDVWGYDYCFLLPA